MKKIIIFILFVFLRTTGYAQDKEALKDGYQIFKYPNGTVSSEGLIKNGKPEGFWKSYYVTGVKKSEGKRTNFMLDSIWLFYDQAGDTTEKINYLYGKKTDGIINIKKTLQEEYISGQKSFMRPIEKKELLLSIFRKEKHRKHILITQVKKKVYQKSMIKKEIL
jgi:hypothetical protein